MKYPIGSVVRVCDPEGQCGVMELHEEVGVITGHDLGCNESMPYLVRIGRTEYYFSEWMLGLESRLEEGSEVINPMVTIPQKEYLRLTKRDEWLCCLEAAGIDNTDAYSHAQEMWNEGEEDE